MDYFSAASFLLAVGRAIYEYGWAAPASAAERARQQREILDAIRTSNQILLDTAVALNVAELSGEVQGFLDIYDTYDADPNDPVEEGRLESLISDSARVIGRLSSNIALLPNPDSGMDPAQEATLVNLALESAGLVIPLIFLRVQAMVEREITYGAQEIDDTRGFLDRMVNRLAPVIPNLRERSDSRFTELGIWKDPEPGVNFRVYYYKFSGLMVMCFPTTLPNARERSESSRAARMNAEFLRFEGGAAPVLSEAIAAMEKIRDAPDPSTGLPERPIIVIDHGGVFARATRVDHPSTEEVLADSSIPELKDL
jgi:hypothetical protein